MSEIKRMKSYLTEAESFIASVYHYAVDNDLTELKSLMCNASDAISYGHNILKTGMSKEEMMNKLDLAQQLLSDVYHDACENGNSYIESNMSVADSCIIDVKNSLESLKK